MQNRLNNADAKKAMALEWTVFMLFDVRKSGEGVVEVWEGVAAETAPVLLGLPVLELRVTGMVGILGRVGEEI